MRDERRLARRAARGDRDAFTTIFRRHQQDLYRYCVAILGNPEDAQDALQNTMVKALGALPGEQREIELKPWLYRIAHNESIDLIRRRRQNVPLEESEPVVGSALAEQVETRQRLRQLIADVGALPERQRGALLMREAGGLKFDEIAAALGTTPGVARQTLYEARLGLREMEAGREMECTAITKALSDGDRRTRRRRDIRAHLRGCFECRRFAEEIDSRRHALASISPLPAVAAAAILHGLAGGGGGTGAAAAGVGTGVGGTGVGGTGVGGTGVTGGGAGLGGMAGAGAAKSIGAATLLKGAAAIAVVAAIGVGGADVGGLFHAADHGRARAQAHVATADGQGPKSGSPLPTDSPVTRPVSDRVSSNRSSRHGPADARSGRSAISALPLSSRSPDQRSATRTRSAPDDAIAAPTTATDSASQGKSAVEHPHGRGHLKQTPASAAHGQETAAANRPKGKPGSAASSPNASESPPPQTAEPARPAAPVRQAEPPKPEKATPAPVVDEAPLAADESPPVVEEGAPAQAEEPLDKEKGHKP